MFVVGPYKNVTVLDGLATVAAMKTFLASLFALLALAGCASHWKVHGGPQECVSMCEGWGMKLVGMVGVGDQARTSGGASACVCEVIAEPASSGGEIGASGTSSALSAAVVAMQQARQRQQQSQQTHQRY